MTSLHRSYTGLLVQDLVSGQQTSKYRYSPIFKQKEAPNAVKGLWSPSEPLSIVMKLDTDRRMTSLHRSNGNLLASFEVADLKNIDIHRFASKTKPLDKFDDLGPLLSIFQSS